MSKRNGDKARFHLKRKARIRRRTRMRELEKAQREQAAKGGSKKA